MPTYEYKGLNGAGEVISGILTADTPREARERLRSDSVHVTQVDRVRDARERTFKLSMPRLFQRRKLQEITLLTRQFATLIDAGIPLADALNALIEQAENKAIEKTLRDVREKVVQGVSLENALAGHPAYFNDLYINMIKAGEASGTLDVVLAQLADYIQKQNQLRNKVSAALTYPAILVVIGIGVVTFLMSFVVPKILTLFAGLKKELPLPTKILKASSELVVSYWWVILAVVIGITVVMKLISRTEKGRFWLDSTKLRIPILGNLFKKQSISRFSVTFSTLLKSKLAVLESLEIVQGIVNNVVLAKTIEDVHRRILEGTDIATPLKQSKVFPPVVGYMIAVGEQSGRLEQLLDKISQSYDEEIELATHRITTLLEPVMIVVMATVVGFIILSILLPILDITKSVR